MSRETQIACITATLDGLTEGQLMWIERTAGLFSSPMDFDYNDSGNYFSREVLQDFGDTLRIHHAFSVEAFSKDKFEYALEHLLKIRGVSVKLAPKGNPGHDITIAGDRASLKTQADKSINDSKIHISKYMELGAGNWSDKPSDLEGLRDQFLQHMVSYERIFTLRCLKRKPVWCYETVSYTHLTLPTIYSV